LRAVDAREAPCALKPLRRLFFANGSAVAKVDG
jgi:hypothetical protein